MADKVLIFQQIDMFQDLSAAELDELSRTAIERSFPKKTIIFHEGSEREAVYFIAEGLVKTYKTDENGHEQIVSFLREGQMFPHTGFFDTSPYPATAETIVNTMLLAVPVQSFERMLIKHPSMAVKIMRVMSRKIQELQVKLQEISGQDVHERTLSFLLNIAEHYGTRNEAGIRVAVPMTNQDIANAIGTSRESVNRLLNQLRKEGIIEKDRRGFVIHSIDSLRNWRQK